MGCQRVGKWISPDPAVSLLVDIIEPLEVENWSGSIGSCDRCRERSGEKGGYDNSKQFSRHLSKYTEM